MEPENHEEQMLSSYVPPPPTIKYQDRFHTFVPLMEKSAVIIESYTYNSTSKKVIQRIVKKTKISEYLEK